MSDKEFFKAIELVNRKRAELFEYPICQTEKYRTLCNQPSRCTGDKEQELLATLAELNEHLRYNNYELLLQIRKDEQKKFVEKANDIISKIGMLVQTIDWGEE